MYNSRKNKKENEKEKYDLARCLRFVRTDLSLEAEENNIVCVSSISTTHFVPKSISVRPQKNKINLRCSNTKSKPVIRYYELTIFVALPRRLKGLTRTATLTLELIMA